MTRGQRIKEQRIKSGLSVDEIADKIGKNRATVYRYESEDIDEMPVSVLTPLAQILHTTPAYLMGWETEQGESIINESSELKKEVIAKIQQLSESNLAKLIELVDLYLASQDRK